MTAWTAEFRHGGLTVLGSSFAGEESFLVMPELNLAFDVGRAPREVIGVDHVFLSHGHMDHSAGIAYYFGQRLFLDNDPGNIYMPEQLTEPARRLMSVWGDIDGREPPSRIHAAIPGQDIPLRRDLIVRPFRVNHPCRGRLGLVESLGYAAIEIRRKLKEEFHGLPGPRLVELKEQGVEITVRTETPLAAYCGDTAAGDFLDLEYVRKARILLLECTFVEREHLERAQAGRHFHVSHLREALARLENERIVLTHLSRRSVFPEALRQLRAEIGDEADERVTFLMDARRYRKSRRQNTSESC